MARIFGSPQLACQCTSCRKKFYVSVNPRKAVEQVDAITNMAVHECAACAGAPRHVKPDAPIDWSTNHSLTPYITNSMSKGFHELNDSMSACQESMDRAGEAVDKLDTACTRSFLLLAFGVVAVFLIMQAW